MARTPVAGGAAPGGTLLEREHQLSVLAGALAAVRAGGGGRLALIAGEAGVGKSALVRHFCAAHLVVLRSWAASRAVYITLFIPPVAVVLSAWLDHEPVTPGLLSGGALIVTGVYIGAVRTARQAAPARPGPGAAGRVGRCARPALTPAGPTRR